jgi:hypothetical protein
MSIGSRKYKTRAHTTDEAILVPDVLTEVGRCPKSQQLTVVAQQASMR